jgi:hypothetical protein
MIESKSAQGHSSCVQPKGEQQQEIDGAVTLAKSFSPQENRINHAQSVNGDGEQKKVSICRLTSKPIHENRVTGWAQLAMLKRA